MVRTDTRASATVREFSPKRSHFVALALGMLGTTAVCELLLPVTLPVAARFGALPHHSAAVLRVHRHHPDTMLLVLNDGAVSQFSGHLPENAMKPIAREAEPLGKFRGCASGMLDQTLQDSMVHGLDL